MRTTVITGSASGIGAALRDLLQARGERVIGVDLRNADVNVDLTTASGRAGLVDQVRELSGGTIDAIVANAGLAIPIPATVAVNYFGALATLDGLRPLLAGSEAPRAAATCSMASLQAADDELLAHMAAGDEPAALARAEVLSGDPKLANTIYGSTKQALARWLRRQAPTPAWAGAGIPLNAIGPGVVATAMTAGMTQNQDAVDSLLKLVPMPLNGIMGPQAPAELLAYLVSPANSHLCGQVIFVDGGYDVVTRGESTW